MSTEAFEKLRTCLEELPGVGRRSAERMAWKLVRDPDGLLREMISAMQSARETLTSCSRCGSVTSRNADPCRLCSDESRERTVLCVVEEPADIPLIERSGVFRGGYHALMGRISPMRGEGPAELRVRHLLKRVAAEGIREVLLALSTDVEGDATASYLADCLRDRGVKISRLAFGLPVGSGLTYSDPVTVARAIRGRQQV